MTDFEKYSLILGSFNIFLLIVGFVLAFLQLRGARNDIQTLNHHHSENHDWNRRKAAQEALSKYDHTFLSSPVHENFDYLNVMDPIPIAEIEEKFAKNNSLQSDIHNILNYYEALARGINQQIFDESVVKSAIRNSVIRCERSFLNFIEKRRRNVNPRAWIELSHIATKWANETSIVEVRKLTGNAQR